MYRKTVDRADKATNKPFIMVGIEVALLLHIDGNKIRTLVSNLQAGFFSGLLVSGFRSFRGRVRAL